MVTQRAQMNCAIRDANRAIQISSLGSNSAAPIATRQKSCPAVTMLSVKRLNEMMLPHAAAAGVDSDRLKSMLGPERLAKMESAIKDLDDLNHRARRR
jgi:hypothetical protein